MKKWEYVLDSAPLQSPPPTQSLLAFLHVTWWIVGNGPGSSGVYRKVDLLQDCSFAAYHLVYGLKASNQHLFLPNRTIVITMINASLSEEWQRLIHCGLLHIVTPILWTQFPSQFYFPFVRKRFESSKDNLSVSGYRLGGRPKVKIKPPPDHPNGGFTSQLPSRLTDWQRPLATRPLKNCLLWHPYQQ